MSVIFGTCLSPGCVVDDKSLVRMGSLTARYGPDGTSTLTRGRVGMGFQAFHTHLRSHFGGQPVTDHLGNLVVLDGRIDNPRELEQASGVTEGCISDSALVLMAFEQWGESCFSHFVGDWATALWSARDHTLYLARDHAGSRTLFFRNVRGRITWSTYLETFFVDDVDPQLDQEYIARFLSHQEIRDLTPYKGILAVPPGHYIAVRERKIALRPHWRPIADSEIAYRSDTEYDQHFLHLFRQAVQRRIVPGAPILAELSGGMDSTSIVCVADKILRESHSLGDQLDSISYFDDTEPDWDDRTYFTAVERHRNKKGIHLDCSLRRPTYEPLILTDRVYPYPDGDRLSLDVANQFENAVSGRQYRVILSGIGGDELLGGIPTPMPELGNCLRSGRLLKLLLRAGEWAIVNRRPVVQLLRNTVTFTRDLYRPARVDSESLPPWLSTELRRICSHLRLYPGVNRHLLSARPSAIFNGRTWWNLLESLPHLYPRVLGSYEYRYPYLDRDLVEFLHRVPREQLVRPGRRRALMRRALKAIVPSEILERKRKAYVSRGPIANLRREQQKIETLFSNSLSAEYGFIDQDRFLRAFRAEIIGDVKWVGHLSRTIEVELWLRSLAARQATIRFETSSLRKPNELLPDPNRANELREYNAAC